MRDGSAAGRSPAHPAPDAPGSRATPPRRCRTRWRSTSTPSSVASTACARPARSHRRSRDARPSAVLVALADGPRRGRGAVDAPVPSTCATTRARSASRAVAWTRARRRSTPPSGRPTRRSGCDPAEVVVVGELEPPQHGRQPQLHRAHRRPPPRAGCSCRRPARRWSGCCGCRWPSSFGPTRTGPSAGAGARPTASCYFFELDDETVWGATAAMLVDLLRRLA